MGFLNGIGTTEIVVIAIVILVLFGGKKMNEWAKGIGEAGHELKKAKKEFESSFNEEEKKPLQGEPEEKTEERKEVA